MALISKTDLKGIEITDLDTTTYDSLLTILCTAVQQMFEQRIGRELESESRTEYYNGEKGQSVLCLKHFPVTALTSLHDDPDWEWGSDSELTADDDFRLDSEKGIIYNDGSFYEGNQNIKVVYTAGYSQAAFDSDQLALKEVFLRQVAMWYKDAKTATWGKTSESNQSGATSKKTLEEGLLPEFILLANLWKSRGSV